MAHPAKTSMKPARAAPKKQPDKDPTPVIHDVRSPFGIAYRVEAAAELLDIGRTKMWALVYEGRLPARKIDGATVILHDDLVAFARSAPLYEPTNAAQ